MAKTLGAADGNILKQTQVAFGDGGAAVASYKAFDESFKSASAPGMKAMQAEYARQEGTFNALMENKPPLETVPLLEDTQLAGNENVVGMEGLMKEVSGMYQEYYLRTKMIWVLRKKLLKLLGIFKT